MITVVSGLPRSGTSMLMRMLHAGGMPILADDFRRPDNHNIHGYFEYAQAKHLEQDTSWLKQAEGKAVKIVSPLLFCLPSVHEYSVIFTQRPLMEIQASQHAILNANAAIEPHHSPRVVMNAFRNHLNKLNAWLKQQKNFRVLNCEYHRLLEDPRPTISDIIDFLGCDLDEDRMRGVIDPGLCHHRTEGN